MTSIGSGAKACVAAFKRGVLALVVVTLALAGCAAGRDAGSQGSSATPAPSMSASAPAVFLVEGTHYPSQGHTHLTPGEPDDFVYSSDPPTSGPHRELFTDAFINSAPIPKYTQAHLLEHGNVLLQYDCTCPDVIAALTAIALRFDKTLVSSSAAAVGAADVAAAEDAGRAVIVAPYPHMQHRVALTAWTHLETLSGADPRTIEGFINAHLGNPQD